MVTNQLSRIGKRKASAPYKVIENDLKRKIHHGVWPFGAQIPSRLQLAREYGVDLSTLQKAVSTLLAEGVVKSDGKRGTYVNIQSSEVKYVEHDADFDRLIGGNDPAVRPVREPSAVKPFAAPAAIRDVAVVGRFAPEVSEQLVPYVIALALENAIADDKSIALRFSDCFRDLLYSVPLAVAVAAAVKTGVDAVCVIDPEGCDIDEIMAIARAAKTPILFITPQMLEQPTIQVYIDNRYDGYQAGNYLIEQGHRDILFVSLGQRYWGLERLEGVRSAIRHAGLPDSALKLFPTGDHAARPLKRKEFRAPLQAWVRDQLERGSLPNAIIGANDHVALDILEVVEDIGPRPEIAILGFDDIAESRRRGLTSFRPPHFDMAREGARLLRHILDKGEVRGESTHSRLISQLVVRSSTR